MSKFYGPPYSIPTETVKSLYTNNGFNFLEEIYREDKIENEPRWKGKGATKFESVCYILEKQNIKDLTIQRALCKDICFLNFSAKFNIKPKRLYYAG